jgi:signal transduction histidine kinase
VSLPLALSLHRTARSMGRLAPMLQTGPADEAAFRALCATTDEVLRTLEERLRAVEANALSRIKADPVTEARAACEALQPLSKQAGVAFRAVEISAGLGTRAFIDASELRGVLYDLVLNAVEACRDSAEPRVGLTIAAGERKISICVIDNGRGVLPEDREAIFHGRSTKTPPGGQGLAHARAVIESYSGKVILQRSAPWENTVFEVELCRVPS